jgi:hypothetical protein
MNETMKEFCECGNELPDKNLHVCPDCLFFERADEKRVFGVSGWALEKVERELDEKKGN